MACEIFPKNITNNAKNQFLDSFDSVRPSNGGLSVIISEEGSMSDLRVRIQELTDSINKSFHGDKYGDVVSFSKLDSKSYEVSFNVTTELLDAINLSVSVQNIRQVENLPTQQSTVQGSGVYESARKAKNAMEPVTANGVEYIRHKEAVLWQVNKKLSQLLKDSKNPRFKGATLQKINDQRRELLSLQKQIEHQIQVLSNSTPLEIYSILIQDLNSIEADIKNSTNSETIRERLDFVNVALMGFKYGDADNSVEPFVARDAQGNEIHSDARKVLLDKIVQVNYDFSQSLNDFRNKILEEDINYATSKKAFIERLDSSLTPEEKEDAWVKATKASSNDINWLEQTFLGVAASSSNNGVVPQVILSQFKMRSAVRDAEVKVYLDKLKSLMRRFGDKETFDWVFELTKRVDGKPGNKTGNIIGKFSPEYRRALNTFYNLGKANDSTDTSDLEGVDLFKAKMDWISKNVDIIDFTKLPEVKAIYGHLYPTAFTSSDLDMSTYSANLRNNLGPAYESEVNKILTNLQTFQIEQSVLLEDTNDKYRFKKIAENDPWAFMRSLQEGRVMQGINYKPGSTTETTYSNLRGIPFMPKRTRMVGIDNMGSPVYRDTGFYNEVFEKEIETDPLKYEYWETMKDIYTEYINPTYSDKAENMSYGKFEKTWLESIKETKGLAKGSSFMKNMLSQYASYFYEKGFVKESTGNVRKNYADMADSDASKLKRVLEKAPINTVLEQAAQYGIDTTGFNAPKRGDRVRAKDRIVRELAKASALTEYSTDINKVTEALLYMAAAMKAREDVATSSRLLAASERANNPDRKRANDKLDSWIDRMIFNETESYRGGASFLGADFTKNETIKMILEKFETFPIVKKFINSQTLKKLNVNEQKMYKELMKLKEGQTGSDFKFQKADVAYQKITLDSGEVRYYMVIPTINHLGEPTNTVEEITEQEFDEEAEIYFSEMAENLGLDLSLAGIIQGFIKTIIFKGLALNPISGIFNRVEGKTSALIMDGTGQYWKPGNVHTVNNFLEMANLAKTTGYSKKLPINKVRLAELAKLEAFIQQVNIIQNRKNELERASDNNERYTPGEETLFIPAVDNPEYKNQSAILLSILMDTEILDENGVAYKVFDGKQFTAWDLVDGVVKLKPKFVTESNVINWQNFGINENNLEDNSFFTTISKVENAIATSQGNYDPKDTIGATKNIWGRALTVFMKWLPSHILQRFGSGNGIDIFNHGNKAIKGRYRYLENSFSSGVSAITASAILFFGFTPITLGVAGGLTALLAYKAMRQASSKENINREIINLHEFVGFTKAMVVSTINYPLEMFNSKTILSHDALDKFIPGYKNAENLTDQDIANLRAVAKEIGIRIAYITVLMLISKMTWDDDDDKDSARRKFHNFMDNQLTRSMDAVSDYTNPAAMWDNVTRLAFVSYLGSLGTALGTAITLNSKDAATDFLKITPIPRIAYKGGIPIVNLVQDDKEFNSNTWYDKMYKGGGPKSDYMKYREERIAEITKIVDKKKYKGDEREKALSKAKREGILPKSKGMSYEETMQIINSTKSIDKQKAKHKKLMDKKKREEKRKNK